MSNKARHAAQRKQGGRKKWPVVLGVVLAAVLIVLGAGYALFGHYYSRLNYDEGMSEEELARAIETYVESEPYTTPAPDAEPEPAEPDAGEDGDGDEASDEADASEAEVEDIQAAIQAQLAASGGSTISDRDVVNILLIGSDARRRDEQARSDAMLLVSLNQKTGMIVLTSFMRDIYTYIPHYGYNRLNLPYSIAGAEYLIETLEADFGIEIDNYAAVNFFDFADIIDAVDGVDLELTDDEIDYINLRTGSDQVKLGLNDADDAPLEYADDGVLTHLDGAQALAHCRNRFSSGGSDADRTDRQRAVVSALIEKARAMSLGELSELLETVLPLVTTDLTRGDCLSLLLRSPEYLSYGVGSLRIPEVSYSFVTISGMSVVNIDFAANAAIVRQAIYGE